MSTDGSTSETAIPAAEDPEDGTAARPVTPPKKLPLPFALLLLLLIPAIALAIWFGGRRHRIDDKPKAQPATKIAPAPAPPARRARP